MQCFQQSSTIDQCDDYIDSCQLQLSQFAMTFSEQLKCGCDNEVKDLKPTKIYRQDCALEHMQSSFLVSALLTRINFVGALTSLVTNMRKG